MLCNVCVLISACVPTCTDLWVCVCEDVWVFGVRGCAGVSCNLCVLISAHTVCIRIDFCMCACLYGYVSVDMWVCWCTCVCGDVWVCWVCWYCECMNVYVCVYMDITRRVVF